MELLNQNFSSYLAEYKSWKRESNKIILINQKSDRGLFVGPKHLVKQQGYGGVIAMAHIYMMDGVLIGHPG